LLIAKNNWLKDELTSKRGGFSLKKTGDGKLIVMELIDKMNDQIVGVIVAEK
jgi:hypothetical protein